MSNADLRSRQTSEQRFAERHALAVLVASLVCAPLLLLHHERTPVEDSLVRLVARRRCSAPALITAHGRHRPALTISVLTSALVFREWSTDLPC